MRICYMRGAMTCFRQCGERRGKYPQCSHLMFRPHTMYRTWQWLLNGATDTHSRVRSACLCIHNFGGVLHICSTLKQSTSHHRRFSLTSAISVHRLVFKQSPTMLRRRRALADNATANETNCTARCCHMARTTCREPPHYLGTFLLLMRLFPFGEGR